NTGSPAVFLPSTTYPSFNRFRSITCPVKEVRSHGTARPAGNGGSRNSERPVPGRRQQPRRRRERPQRCAVRLNKVGEDRCPAHPYRRHDTPLQPPAGAGSRPKSDRVIRRIVQRGGGWTGLLLVASLTVAGVETVFPAVLGRTVDAVLGGHDPTPWLVGCGLLVALLITSGALNDLAGGMGTARATAWLRKSVLDHILALGTHSTRLFPVGDITTRMVGNAADAGRAGTVLVWAVAALVPAVGGIVALALIDPVLCLTFLAAAPVLLVMVRSNVRNASELAERYLRAQGRIASRLVDALTGARSIAAAHTTA